MNPGRFIYILFPLFSFISSNLWSQDDLEEKFEKFKVQKIAFITEQVKLTPKEAEVFWPIYNEFDAKKQAINLERIKTAKYYLQVKDMLSDKEASDLADKFVALQKQEALLAEEYNIKFKEVLPAIKVLKLYQSELQFKRRLLKQLRQGASKGAD